MVVKNSVSGTTKRWEADVSGNVGSGGITYIPFRSICISRNTPEATMIYRYMFRLLTIMLLITGCLTLLDETPTGCALIGIAAFFCVAGEFLTRQQR